MFSTSIIELNEVRFAKNLEFLKRNIDKKTRISSVVKGNAYGHGIETFVPLALKYGIDHFSVFSANEAYRIYKIIGNKAEIMIMSSLDDEELEWVINNDINFYVFEMEKFDKIIQL